MAVLLLPLNLLPFPPHRLHLLLLLPPPSSSPNSHVNSTHTFLTPLQLCLLFCSIAACSQLRQKGLETRVCLQPKVSIFRLEFGFWHLRFALFLIFQAKIWFF